MLTDRDRETLHRLAAEWRSESASEDRGVRTREMLIGLIGGEGEHFDQHAAYLLALSLVELLSSAHLPLRAGSVVLRALESLADAEGGGEYVKTLNDLRGLPGAPMLPDSPCLSLLPGVGSSSAGGAWAEPRSEGAVESGIHGTAGEPSPARRAARSSDADPMTAPAGGDASAAWDETPDPEAAEDAVPILPGVDLEALARRAMQFAGNGVPDGARSRTPFAGETHGADARGGAPATPGLEPVLFLESGGERFALRAGDVTGILDAGGHDAARIDGRPPVFVHRGESYHFVDPARALALEEAGGAGGSGPARVIVLLRGGGRRVALLCGGAGEREELPVHALPPMVPREALATAAVIPGDGRPILLLDTAALAEHAGS